MKKRKRQGRSNPSYETLEPRQLLATLTVDIAVDSIGDVQDGRVSLREAIIAANTNDLKATMRSTTAEPSRTPMMVS